MIMAILTPELVSENVSTLRGFVGKGIDLLRVGQMRTEDHQSKSGEIPLLADCGT